MYGAGARKGSQIFMDKLINTLVKLLTPFAEKLVKGVLNLITDMVQDYLKEKKAKERSKKLQDAKDLDEQGKVGEAAKKREEFFDNLT